MLISLGNKPSAPIKFLAAMAIWLSAHTTVWALASGADSINGYWVMPDSSALIEVYSVQPAESKEREYSVRIVALRDPRFTVVDKDAPSGELRRDIYNPDVNLRQRPLEGLTIASGLKYKDGIWGGGKIYDPGSGGHYRCQLEQAPGGYLKVRGYMGISLLGRTMYWQRADDFKRRVADMLKMLPAHE